MIRYQCDCCLEMDDDEMKVYELSDEVKDYTCLEYDHLCKQCLKDLEDKSLYVSKGKICIKKDSK